MTALAAIDMSCICWADGYTVTPDGLPIVAWNGEETSTLHWAAGLTPLTAPGANRQTGPVSTRRFVAYLTETPTGYVLTTFDRQTQRVLCHNLPPSHRPYSLAAYGEDQALAVRMTPCGTGELCLIDYRQVDPARTIIELPGGRDWLDPAPSVNARGEILVMARGRGACNDLLQVAPGGGGSRVILQGSPTGIPVAATWSPNGRQIACLVRRGQTLGAVVVDAATLSTRELPVPPLREMPVWDANGERLILTLDEWPTSRLGLFDPETGSLQRIEFLPDRMMVAPSWHADRLYFLAMAPQHPLALYVSEAGEGEPVQLTPVQPLPHMPRPEVIRVVSAQGHAIPCLLYRGDPNNTRAVLMLHGGPAGCWWAGWSPPVQLLVSEGYNVVLVNPRGSTIRTWPLPPLRPGEFGRHDVADVLACMDYVLESGLAKSGQIALYGLSYGGFLACRAALKRPGDVAAVVILHSYIHLAAAHHSPDPAVQRFLAHAFAPEELAPPNGAIWFPGPLLQIHGECDHALPADVVRAMHARLEGRGHQFLLLEGEGHTVRQKHNVTQWLEAVRQFLSEHIAERTNCHEPIRRSCTRCGACRHDCGGAAVTTGH